MSTKSIIKTNAKITSIKKLSSTVNHFILTLDEPISYESGQFVNLIYKTECEKIRRSYSIAGNYQESSKEIELCIKLLENGKFTPILFSEKSTDIIFQAMGPLGLFKLRGIEENKNQVFIGAGTGVAPLRSFILDLLKNKEYQSNIILLLGIRFEHEILYNEEFLELEEEFPNFTFIPTLSKPTQKWRGKVGYVQEHINDIAELEKSEFYICGLTTLVDECEFKLLELGIDKKNIKSEKYG